MTIALDATYLSLAEAQGVDATVLHRIAAIAAGTLHSLPHNGVIVTLLAVCGTTHRDSYFHVAVAVIVGPIVALAAIIVLGSVFGSF